MAISRLKNDIATFSRRVALAITVFYSLNLPLREIPAKPISLSVDLAGSNGQSVKDLSISYPHRIETCRTESGSSD